MADCLYLTNDNGGTRIRRIHINWGQAGNHTTVTALPVFTVPVAGRISAIHFSSVTYPTTHDRTATITIKKVSAGNAAATVCTTDASFAATAGGSGQKSTDAGGTGITAAVLKTDGSATFAAGDTMTLDFAIAGSNGTVGTGASATIDFVPAATALSN